MRLHNVSYRQIYDAHTLDNIDGLDDVDDEADVHRDLSYLCLLPNAYVPFFHAS